MTRSLSNKQTVSLANFEDQAMMSVATTSTTI